MSIFYEDLEIFDVAAHARKYFSDDLLAMCSAAVYGGDNADGRLIWPVMQMHLNTIRDAMFNPKNTMYGKTRYSDLPKAVQIALMPDFLGLGGRGSFYEFDVYSSGEVDGVEKAECYVWASTGGTCAPIEEWHRRRNDIIGIIGHNVRYRSEKGGVQVYSSGAGFESPFDRELDELEAKDGKAREMKRRAAYEGMIDRAAELYRHPYSPQEEFTALPDVLEFVETEYTAGGHLHEGWVFLGTSIRDEKPYWKELSTLQHHLVVGMSGYGKSVFLNQFLQGVRHNIASYEAVYLVDLKGGVELIEYQDYGDLFKVVYRYEELDELVASLVVMMEERLTSMRENRLKKWTGKRILFVIDEYAQIALRVAETKEEKAAQARLLANLNKLSMLGRAVGLLLWVQLQKATTDVMDSSFRNNLQAQVCFRVSSRLAAASLFGEAKDLEIDPTRLQRGQFIYFDDATGETVYLQAHMRTEEKEAA